MTLEQLNVVFHVGAAVSMMLLLLPYANLVFIPAYILGPLAGGW